MTNAYFDNIKQVLCSELSKADSSILIAVAWFTDRDLFELLCEKAGNKVNVEVIIADDEINTNSNLNFEKLIQIGGKFTYYSGQKSRSLMHNKFCIIDMKTTITGSYNWSYQATHNRENITVTYDSKLALQFSKYFYSLKFGTHFQISELTEKELSNLTYYIRKIKEQIESNELEEIVSSIYLLNNLNYGNNDIYVIAKLLENQQWTQALQLISIFLKSNQQLAVYEDLELSTLIFHKESLEDKLDKLILHKNDLERKIHQFTIEYNQKLGDVLIELFELKKQHNLGHIGAFNEYKEKVDEARKTNMHDLNEQEIQELKSVYKKAALLCHPDKVDEFMKFEAEEIFKSLNSAYKNNDIEEVNRIFKNILNNNFLVRKKTYDSKVILKQEIAKLLYKIDQIQFEISKLKLSSYNNVFEKVYDWDLFYRIEREKIMNEINEIKIKFSKKTVFKKEQRKYSTKIK